MDVNDRNPSQVLSNGYETGKSHYECEAWEGDCEWLVLAFGCEGIGCESVECERASG